MKLFAHAVMVEFLVVIGALIGVGAFALGTPARIIARLQGRR